MKIITNTVTNAPQTRATILSILLQIPNSNCICHIENTLYVCLRKRLTTLEMLSFFCAVFHMKKCGLSEICLYVCLFINLFVLWDF